MAGKAKDIKDRRGWWRSRFSSKTQQQEAPVEAVDPVREGATPIETETASTQSVEPTVENEPVIPAGTSATTVTTPPAPNEGASTQVVGSEATKQDTDNDEATQVVNNNDAAKEVDKDPYGIERARAEYESALARQQAADAQREQTLRDLLDKYKPETDEERKKRERNERIRKNIAAVTSMGAALANLGIAIKSPDGRVVNVANTPEAVDKAVEKERTIQRERDAKAEELRNRYMESRRTMANQDLSNAREQYKFSMKQKADADKLQVSRDKEAGVAERAKAKNDVTREGQRIQEKRIDETARHNRAGEALANLKEEMKGDKENKVVSSQYNVNGKQYDIANSTFNSYAYNIGPHLPGDADDPESYAYRYKNAATQQEKVMVVKDYLGDTGAIQSNPNHGEIETLLQEAEDITAKARKPKRQTASRTQQSGTTESDTSWDEYDRVIID